MPINGTTKALHFCVFIWLLCRFIKDLWETQTSHLKIILENASIHLTEEVKRVWSYWELEINTIPAYTPQLAPVELVFGISKRKIQRQTTRLKVNFWNPSGKKVVMESLKSIDVATCSKIWSKFVRISKYWIITARKSARLNRFLQSDYERKEKQRNIEEILLGGEINPDMGTSAK